MNQPRKTNGAYNKKGTWSVYKVFQHVMKEQTCVFVEDVYDMYGFQLGILERRCRQKMWRNTFGHGFSGWSPSEFPILSNRLTGTFPLLFGTPNEVSNLTFFVSFSKNTSHPETKSWTANPLSCSDFERS